MLEQYYTVFELFADNRLPCFVKLSKNGETGADILYLDKIINSDFTFAREYHLNTEKCIDFEQKNQSKESNCCGTDELSICDENSSSKESESIEFDDCIIPAGYEGLLEIIPDTTKEQNQSLSHETDLISLACRIREPKVYFIAKPLKLYDATTASGIKSTPITFDIGTLCVINKIRFIQYSTVDCANMKRSVFKKIMCFCDRYKKSSLLNFDIAIEFEILKNLHDPTLKSLSERLYYLPIYKDPNDTIDLIPIAYLDCLKINNLQKLHSLIQIEQPFRVKIKPNRTATSVNDSNCSSTIFEIYERKQSQFVVGLLLNNMSIVLYSMDNSQKFVFMNPNELNRFNDEHAVDELVQKIYPKISSDFFHNFQHEIHRVYLGQDNKPLVEQFSFQNHAFSADPLGKDCKGKSFC